MFNRKETKTEDEEYKELNEKFEQNLGELADLLKEIHDKIISSEIDSREELVAVYRKRMDEMVKKFPDANDERVKPYFDRYGLILNKFKEYKEKKGNI